MTGHIQFPVSYNVIQVIFFLNQFFPDLVPTRFHEMFVIFIYLNTLWVFFQIITLMVDLIDFKKRAIENFKFLNF